MRRFTFGVAFVATTWLALAHCTLAAPQVTQLTFPTAEAAADALAGALRANDTKALHAIFGPGSEAMLWSGDKYADQEGRRRFLASYDEKHTLVPQGSGRDVLEIGNDGWPVPIPIVQSDNAWKFDTQAGAQEIIDRRIGRNELAAIRVALTYVDAQKDYFERMKQGTGTGFYAERMVSTPGQHDGLYWPAEADGAESPFGPLVAQAEGEGYPGAGTTGKPIPYQGYYFRILKAQGPDAPGGSMSYVKSGRMTDGFALLAWPARFANSGIMTFQINQDGSVYQKNLGPGTSAIAARIEQFDPDVSWARVEVTNQ